MAIDTGSMLISSAPKVAVKRCKVAVIGGGISGIVTAKCLRDDGHQVTLYESTDQVGGIWVYRKTSGGTFESVRFQNSKYLSAFSDYPMPEQMSDFPHHTEILAYLNSYVDHFRLRECIRLNCQVEKVSRSRDHWKVTVSTPEGAASESFDALAICSGVFREPRWPNIPGEADFKGTLLHAKDYKEPSMFANKRVVVMGNGASGVDIAVRATDFAQKVIWSFRRNSWLVPRYFAGRPLDCNLSRLYALIPAGVRKSLYSRKFAPIWEAHRQCNLEPAFGLFASIPSANEFVIDLVAKGAIETRPTIAGFSGQRVLFTDGSSTEADIVIYATGYGVSFPFFDASVVPVHNEGTDLYKHVFHPDLPNCGFIGIIRVIGALLPCAEMQARWFSKVLSEQVHLPDTESMRAEIQRMRAQQQKDWVASGYRSFQVRQVEYTEEIARLIDAVPKVWRHWQIAWQLLTGPMLPTHYRLDGPNPWKGAEEWIRQVPDLIKIPRNASGVGVGR
ncbi:NAD(P)-binding domain-containing protein [Gloeobacter violaceus]|uniref:NAD(P)-binding domain-containing protein n=1 Tax=Gloeobacter violaceus TaxID=33072 RepID=UPI0013E8CAA3|nr:NAD(P)-binding domain-containing protein [Gloeobacter violaceus]